MRYTVYILPYSNQMLFYMVDRIQSTICSHYDFWSMPARTSLNAFLIVWLCALGDDDGRARPNLRHQTNINACGQRTKGHPASRTFFKSYCAQAGGYQNLILYVCLLSYSGVSAEQKNAKTMDFGEKWNQHHSTIIIFLHNIKG